MHTVTGFQVWGQYQNGEAILHRTFRNRKAAERFIDNRRSSIYGEDWEYWVREFQVNRFEIFRF